MILTQKYHSILEIDHEFIPGLEALLIEYAPSFEWFKNFESNAPKSTHFTYYLFFGDRNNVPIGFAQVAITSCMQVRPWYRKFLNTTSKKHLNWHTPTSSTEGVIVDPFYSKKAIDKTKDIIMGYFDRSEIEQQSLTLSSAYDEINQGQQMEWRSKKYAKKIANTLVKSGNSYENYLEQQSDQLRKHTQHNWKKLYSSMGIEIGDFNSFKAIFEYRSNGANLYKNLKKDQEIIPYLSEKTTYVTFEKDKEIQAILFLVKGQRNHYFFDWKIFNSEVTAQMMIQLAILKFYELNHATHLHPLFATQNFKLLEEAGLSGKSLSEVTLNKTRQKVTA
jgi:hypothetical protein